MIPSISMERIRERAFAVTSWNKLVSHNLNLRQNQVPLNEILEAVGLEDTLWFMRALDPEYDNQVRLLACDLVEPTLKLFPKERKRLRKVIKTVRKYVRGEVSLRRVELVGHDARSVMRKSNALSQCAAASAITSLTEPDIIDHLYFLNLNVKLSLYDQDIRQEQREIFERWLGEGTHGVGLLGGLAKGCPVRGC